MRIRVVALLLVLLSLAGAAGAAPKVVVLGFDGADAAVTERLMAEGRLPNLSKLAAEGGYWPLLPTNPPQTPVSWSTFATGLNPGRTEIFDFIKKQGRDYAPTLCAFEEGRADFLFGKRNRAVFAAVASLVGLVPLLFALKFPGARRRLVAIGLCLGLGFGVAAWLFAAILVPETRPQAINNRKGATFWELAVRAGHRARIIRVPVTFPTDALEGLTMISGLGVPDIRGLNGQPTLYTTREGLSGGQFSVKIAPMKLPGDAPVELLVEGPKNLLFPPDDGSAPERITTTMALTKLDEGRVRIDCGGTTSTLAPGEWSDWHLLEFDFNPLLSMRGMTRFYNQSTHGTGQGDEFTDVVMSPIHIHPEAGGRVGFCHPGDHSLAMSREIGLFKTMGWSIDTWTVQEGLTSDQMCLDDSLFTMDGMEKLMLAEIGHSSTEDLYVQVFSFTDRIQHIFWRLTDPGHPAYDAELAKKFEGVIERAYERMDRIVGEARAKVPPDTAFFVLSDHGFASFRRGVNLNRWLVNHGFMVLREDPCSGGEGGHRSLDDLFEDTSGVFDEVNWSRTRAFAMGLGNVYVNLAGREAQGIVRPGAEYEQLVADISSGLQALVDPTNGEAPVSRVYRRDDMYKGYDPELIADLRVANTAGYRVSWDTVLGGIPCEEIVDNKKAWGADHCSLDPHLVKGILFSSRPLRTTAPEMPDLAPTLLDALGVPVPPDLDGKSLL